MKKVLLIGNPTEHSLSPVFQQVAFDHLNLPWEYHNITTRSSELESVVGSMRSGGIIGANVTVPYKISIISFLDELAPSAKKIGAVNTVQIIRDKAYSRLIGHNTDIEGFRASVVSQRVTVETSIASVIGTGGASLAVIAGLQSLGVKQIHLIGRNIIKVRQVADKPWSLEITPHDLASIPSPELTGLLAESSIIVQATSVGMAGGPAPNQTPIPHAILESALENSTRHQLLVDLVYSPTNTLFLSTASKLGVTGINGLEMLLRQGAAAFEIWTGQAAPIDVMRASLKEAGIS
jgi:shikimate dehydrogenase